MKFTKEKNIIKATGSLREAWACYQARNSFAIKANNQNAAKVYSDARETIEFCGGSTHDLQQSISGQGDISLILRAKKDLEVIKKDFQTSMNAHKSRRKRRMSEHDGDWDFDRQWDIAPFSASHKQPQATRTLKITAYFGATYGTEAKQLNQYGAYVAAIIELLESQGITIALDWANKGNHVFATDKSKSVLTKIRIKEPGEYISTQALAAAFNANFFRRLCFWARAAAADSVKAIISESFGRTENPYQAVQSKPGELILSPQHNTLPDTQEVIEGLKKALR